MAGHHPADDFTISPREYADDDAWFGTRANPDGRVNIHIAGVTDAPGLPERRYRRLAGK
ncbi:hypothetical protein [Arthrobacter globiformis]|uniref:hypothetical protein n=1 Tax=Arthrobacter globiformis TaxID=1665 RepID=UPI00278210F9|nr:hypothetical protein [Arthrobacter globiformis]MDQ0867450.1 hypothetical protein [Arthrobacter globiformis]